MLTELCLIMYYSASEVVIGWVMAHWVSLVAGPLGLYYSFLDPYVGQHEFTWYQANDLCQRRGMQLVSLDSYYKDHIVSQLIYQYGKGSILCPDIVSQFHY